MVASRAELADTPPMGEQLTAYDRAHATTYLRLLDADAAGASTEEVIRHIFKLRLATDDERLERMHAAHLARAKWLRDGGYLQLLQQPAG